MRKTIVIISIILLVGFALRLYLALIIPVSGDAGIFLYWAGLINAGDVPYRDFLVRDPLYIYLVTLSTRVLGPNFLALSLVSVIPGAATIPVVYKIAQEIFGRRSGLVAALTYTFAPTVIWYSTAFDERTLMLFLSACALWTLILALKKRQDSLFIAYGLILGAATFAYRGIAIYLVTVPVIISLYFLRKNDESSRDYRAFLRFSAESVLGYALSAGTMFAYFSLTSSFSWMISNFGFSGQQESASYFISGEVASLSFRTRVFDVFVREWLFIVIPAGVIILAILFSLFGRKRQLFLVTAGFLGSVFLVASIAGLGYFPQSSYGSYEPAAQYSSLYLVCLVLLITLGAGLLPSVVRSLPACGKLDLRYVLGIYWFLSTALFLALFGVPLVNYYYYFAPILTVIASPAILSAIRLVQTHFPRRLPDIRADFVLGVLFIGLLTGSAVSVTGMLLTTEMTWRDEPSIVIQDIASYIHMHTNPHDEIISRDPAIAVLAQRKEAMGISEWQIYGKKGPEPFNPLPYDPFHLFPNVTEIARYISEGNVKYVVGDKDGVIVSIIALHPIWEQEFVTNFNMESTVDGIPIFRFNPTWDLSQHLKDISSYSNSTLYSYSPGMGYWTDGFGHVLISCAPASSLPPVGGMVKPNQVSFLPPVPAGNSYIEISLPGDEYTNLTTSFALADGAVATSTGVTYSIVVVSGSQQLSTFSSLVTSNNWRQSNIPLSTTSSNLTIILAAESGASSAYDWLQLTFTLLR